MSWRCSKLCGWIDASSHTERFDGDPCPRCSFGVIETVRDPDRMKLVVIESPFGTNEDGSRATPEQIETNIRYARACMADCLRRNEAPYASHAIYTLDGVLDDTKPEERKKGMEAGFVWGAKADLVAVYCDLGITSGMRTGIERSKANRIPCEERRLDGEWGIEGAVRRFDRLGRLGG